MANKNYTEELIKNFREKYNLTGEDFWELQQRKGTWIVSHRAVEKIALTEGYNWKLEVLNFSPDVVVKCILTTADGKTTIESLGEATPNNNKNQYPYAMAEKRAVDRCVLKLANAHGYLYTDDDAEDFKKEKNVPATDKIKDLANKSPINNEVWNESSYAQ